MCQISRKTGSFHVLLFICIYLLALFWRWSWKANNKFNYSSFSLNDPTANSKKRDKYGIPAYEKRGLYNSSQKKKRILFTSQWWQSHFPYLNEANKFCPRCSFTENQALWGSSDAIIFHGRMLPKIIPKRRRPNEIWVFMLFEALSPSDHPSTFTKIVNYKDQFNWTMTYRGDSDVVMAYGRFVNATKIPRPSFKTSWAYISGALKKDTYASVKYQVTPSLKNFDQRKPIAWISSHCNASSGRQHIVRQLQKYIPIHIYGLCRENLTATTTGSLGGSTRNGSSKRLQKCRVPKDKALSGIDCRIQIQSAYKFYLSFESSVCKDYVTEKYFDVLASTEMVPVVFGGADYAASFPPNSFINVRDFKGPEGLAQHLAAVGANGALWLEYFAWRKNYWVQTNRFVTGYCELCDKLWALEEEDHEKGAKYYKSYKSVWDWWIYKKDGEEGSGMACKNFYQEETIQSIWGNGAIA